MAIALPNIGSNRDVKEVLIEQNDFLEKIDRQVATVNVSVNSVLDVLTKQFNLQEQESERMRLFRENQEFMSAEAAREQREALRRQQETSPTATPTSNSDFGTDAAVAAGIGAAAGGLTSRGGRLRRLAGRLLKGGGLIGIGALFGEQIGNFLGDELEYWAENIGLDEDFANSVGDAARSSTQSAIIGGGITRLLFRRTLPGIIGGIIFDRLGLDRLFQDGGPDEIAQGINEFFQRLKDGELTDDDIANAGIAGAAAVYAGRQIQRGGEAIGNRFGNFRPDGTIQPPAGTPSARPGSRPALRPRRPNGQFMSDAEIDEMAKAIKDSKMRSVFKKIMKKLGPLGIIFTIGDGWRLVGILNGTGTTEQKQQAVGAFIGEFIGGAVGLTAGAYVGAFGGPWGAVIGGILGAVGGAFAGEYAGVLIAKWAWDESPPAPPSIGGISSQDDVDAYLRQLGIGPNGQTISPPRQSGPNDLSSYSQYLQPSSYNATATARSGTGTTVNDLVSELSNLTGELRKLNNKTQSGDSNISADNNPLASASRQYSTYLASMSAPSTASNQPQAVLASASGNSSLMGGAGDDNLFTNASFTSSQGLESSDIDNILATIRQKESNSDYDAYNYAWDEYVRSNGRRGSSATGAYQFIKGTWSRLANKYGIGTEYEFARDAPPSVQDAVARRYVQDILRDNGGNVSAIPNTWYTGNAQGVMSELQLETNRGLTAAEYQADWLTRYANISGGSAPAVITTPGSNGSNNVRPSTPNQSITSTSNNSDFKLGATLSEIARQNNPSVVTSIQRPQTVYNISNSNGSGGGRPNSPRDNESSLQRAMQRMWSSVV